MKGMHDAARPKQIQEIWTTKRKEGSKPNKHAEVQVQQILGRLKRKTSTRPKESKKATALTILKHALVARVCAERLERAFVRVRSAW